MKKKLFSICFPFLAIIIFISGFLNLVSATEDRYDFSQFNDKNFSGKWGDPSSPTSEYTIWGFTNKTYNFTTNFSSDVIQNTSKDKTMMVFYWSCAGKTINLSDYTLLPIDDTNRNSKSWICSHKWENPGTYFVAAGLFQNGIPVNVSYWVPIKIVDPTGIKVQDILMVDEDNVSNSKNNSFDEYYVPILSFFKGVGKREYCAYAKNDYSFSVVLDAKCLTSEDNRSILETTTLVNWGDTSRADNNAFAGNLTDPDSNDSGIYFNSTTKSLVFNENYSHEWREPGERTISAGAFHYDSLDGRPVYTDYFNKNILIINDPQNFVSSSVPFISFITEPVSNLENLGIFLISAGMMILFFTYTKNRVPVKLSLFGNSTFSLRSVDSFIGILTTMTGMYLYFIFGRCPWDIPIVSNSFILSNLYFGMLYYEYVTRPFHGIPYLTILLGLVDVLVSATIIYRISNPLLKGNFKTGEFFRRKYDFLSHFKISSISGLLRRKSE
jgi:hypothetical protein